MTETAAIAVWLRDLAKEAMAATRLDAIGAPPAGELHTERRGDAFAAHVELADDFDAAAAALSTQFGPPPLAGADAHGVRWIVYKPAYTHGVLLLVEGDGAAVLHLEPHGRAQAQRFEGPEPDVASWFAARTDATSRPNAQRAKDEAARRATRKAASGPARGGRLTPARTRELAGWFPARADAPIDRAAIDRFAVEHELVLDDDHAFAGRTYLTTKLATRIHVDIHAVHVMTILGESEDGTDIAESKIAAAGRAKRHAAIRADVVAALGEPDAEGEHTYISTERWAAWRRAEAVIALITDMDPRGDGGYATALRLVAWPHDRATPVFPGSAVTWIDAELKRVRESSSKP